MDDVTITPLHMLGKDDRGSTYDYSVRPNGDYILIFRKKGSMSGNTYHKGASDATNPKTFVLIAGKLEFNYRHIEQSKHERVVIDTPSLIMVYPMVTHAVKALSDITMLECNAIADIKNDRYFEEVVLDAVQ